ncbi:methyl-accepting chemotaxis protein [Lysinibacillus sp. BW-2-10]|uniref:methyl-accepting chemotaxis protein n=1 Tax=Lysinibacillus sp. BW-2-10 TaxID=2590030 RepID=UPI0011811A13|nr:methyl-accepting chemotaxis protein [Lysinibacillus sp. BW-2-10]TSI11036.1 methyl-accepting chemotaxis protein [Lysinibacillus sp. BW-2-10]
MSKIFRKFSNLKTKLIITFSAVLIIPAIVIGILAYSAAKNAVEHEILKGFSQTINVLNSSIDNLIQPKMNDVENYSNSITSNLYQGEESVELTDDFNRYIELHPEAKMIYIGTDSGEFIQAPNMTLPTNYDPRENDWYKDAINNKGKVIVSEPHITADHEGMVITISKTTRDFSGVVAIDIPLSYIHGLFNEVKIGEKGYAFLLDKQRKYIAHPTIEGGTEAKDDFYNAVYSQEKGHIDYLFNGEEKMMAFATNELTGWKLAGSIVSEEIGEAAAPIFHKTMLVLVSAMIIGAVVVFFIIRSIIVPLNELKDKAITISKGDLTERIEVYSKDSIGQLAEAFNVMQESLQELIQKVEQSVELVASSAEELSASAEETSAATGQVAISIQEVASSAEKQRYGVDETAQSLDVVSEGASTIADHSTIVSELSRHTMVQAEEGGQAVTNTVVQMQSIHKSVMESNAMIQSLNESSKEVSSILNVITGIADQTNLLALNAAIEAARAGEHGKGFAVVADEVRKLAEQSQLSAKEIYAIVSRIQQDTESTVQTMIRVTDDVQAGVKVSNEAIEKFNLIYESTRKITPQMEEVSATAQQMSAAIQEITSAANEMVIIAQGNAATSEEVAASAEEQLAAMEEISQSANGLSAMAEELKEVITKFKY